MDYKVCILAAGKGTRNKYAQNRNKAVLPLGEGTAISYIIDKFPPDIEIIIAIGHRFMDVINEVMSHYLQSPIKYRSVDYEGARRGPGYSLWQCRGLLQCPFIYTCCDTIVISDIPEPDKNWIGVTEVKDRLPYLTLRTKDKLVKQVYDKGDKDATFTASIGLVGVHDYKAFWDGLEHPAKLIQNEHQDTSGLNALIPYKLHAVNFTWFDTGTTEGYENTIRYFNKPLP